MTQIGLALLMIWMMNFAWMIWEVLRCTPDWTDEDAESIAQNFIMNTPSEKLQFIQKVGKFNPWIGLGAVTILIMTMI
jgi:hypothetical protein